MGRPPLAGHLAEKRQVVPMSSLPEAVFRFATDNNIDDSARQMLLEAAPHIQQAVIEEGNLTGRNPSAILASRLRRAEAAHYVPPAGADPIAAFISENGLDEACE